MTQLRLGLVPLLALALSACCEETDYDIAVEQPEGSERSCDSLCGAYLADIAIEDLTYELRSCEEGRSEDGRPLAVCHITEVDCIQSSHM